jgi:hypothetical protein
MDSLGDIGELVCKFGLEPLKSVLVRILTFVAAQSPATLGNLQALTDTLEVQPQESLEVSWYWALRSWVRCWVGVHL